MYLPSSTPIDPNHDADVAREAAASDARILCTQLQKARGRALLFNTSVDPGVLASQFGIGLGVNAQILQDQMQTARVSSLLSPDVTPTVVVTGVPAQAPSVPPQVVPLNTPAASCGRSRGRAAGVTGPQFPGMPKRAPNVVQSPYGPMYFRGADATLDGTQTNTGLNQGLTGIAPSWSDAWVMPSANEYRPNETNIAGWGILAALVGVGIFAASQRGRR